MSSTKVESSPIGVKRSATVIQSNSDVAQIRPIVMQSRNTVVKSSPDMTQTRSTVLNSMHMNIVMKSRNKLGVCWAKLNFTRVGFYLSCFNS